MVFLKIALFLLFLVFFAFINKQFFNISYLTSITGFSFFIGIKILPSLLPINTLMAILLILGFGIPILILMN